MFNPNYIPSDYLREIVLAKGTSAQLFLYYAIFSDLKPMMDDWIPLDRMEIFEKACRKYGLLIQKECLFLETKPIRQLFDKSIGAAQAPTTKSFGAPLNSGYDGFVHVFISKSKEILEEGKRYGTYPLAVNGRVMIKPRFDYLKFGIFLGYPKCCIKFFSEYNNHLKYPNTLFLPFSNTKSKPHFLCNSLTKDSYSYIYHIPCSFACKKTIKLASKLREFIYEKDPSYGRLIDEHLKNIFLVFKEKNMYAFKGDSNKNTIRYNQCFFIDYSIYKPTYLNFFNDGNKIIVEKNLIKIFSNNNLIHKIEKEHPQNGFIISFKD